MPTSTGSTSLFDRWAPSYDRPGLQLLTYRPVHDAVLARVRGSTPSTIVDVGCGTGQLTRRLARRFPDASVVGVDLSAGMLATAGGRLGGDVGRKLSLLRADAARLPFGASTVDLVVCTESFHWYPDQPGVLDGMADVLRPGGQLVIASIATATGVGERLLRSATGARGTPISALPPNRLAALLRRSDFEVTHQRRIPRLGLIAWPVLTDARRR